MLRASIALAALALLAACTESKQPPASGGSSGSSSLTPPPASQVEGGADPSTGVVRYLALGDSFTFGAGAPSTGAFPARLTDRWHGKGGCTVTLMNVAVSGYTTADVIQYELPEVEAFKPTFVTLAIGANDIVKGVSVDDYRKNVRQILEVVKASGARVVTIPQPDWPRAPAAPNYGVPAELAEKRVAFDAALADEARAKGAEWVDLRLLMQQQADKSMVSEDGLHPNAQAYDEWAAELARVLVSPCPQGG